MVISSRRPLAFASVLFMSGACSPSNPPEGEGGGEADGPTASGGSVNSVAASGGTSSGGATGAGGSPNIDQGPETVEVADFYYEGIRYPNESEGEVEFLRFEESLYSATEWMDGFNPLRARTTTGGALVFETTSPKVRLNFRFDAAHENRNSTFGVSQNGGAFTGTFVSKDDATTSLLVNSSSPGERIRYRVSLPNWSNPILTSVTLDDGHELLSFERVVQPVYIALGDSLTHGTGQPSSFEGYALQTSDALGTELYNLSVGGSKVAIPIANSLGDFPRVDLVTVLVGYNDWMNEGKTADEFRTAYDGLLDAIRSHHPAAAIVCLNLLTPEDVTSSASGLPLSSFRQVVTDAVTARKDDGDSNLYVAPSESWTDSGDLSDPVHLTTSGAKKLADALAAFIQTEVNLDSPVLPVEPETPGSQVWDFASDTEGFVAWENANLPEGATTVAHSSDCDGTASGCLRVNVALSAVGQTGGARLAYSPTEDLSGRTITVRYKVLSGSESQITAYAQDASYKVDSVFRPFPESLPSDWREVSFSIDTGDMIDPTDILHIGSQILPLSGAGTIGPAEVLIDSISLE